MCLSWEIDQYRLRLSQMWELELCGSLWYKNIKNTPIITYNFPDCSVCGLTLVSSSLLARSYHHLFPVDGYEEGHADVYKNCFACAVSFQGQGEFGVFVCRKCEKAFCLDCDLFVHESLFNCPGCLLIQR